jgi:hypothetical protein
MIIMSNYIITLLAQGQTQGSTLQERTNKTLTIDPFGNTYEGDEVSPKVEARMFARLKCLKPNMGHRFVIMSLTGYLASINHQYSTLIIVVQSIATFIQI